MRIFLRNVLTRFYLVGEGEWTEDRNLARTFPSSLAALKFVQEHNLPDMEVVLGFNGPEYDLTIPAEAVRPKPKHPRHPEPPAL